MSCIDEILEDKDKLNELLRRLAEMSNITLFVGEVGSSYRITIPSKRRKNIRLGDYVQVLLIKL